MKLSLWPFPGIWFIYGIILLPRSTGIVFLSLSTTLDLVNQFVVV
jgi:hypothetical protein